MLSTTLGQLVQSTDRNNSYAFDANAIATVREWLLTEPVDSQDNIVQQPVPTALNITTVNANKPCSPSVVADIVDRHDAANRLIRETSAETAPRSGAPIPERVTTPLAMTRRNESHAGL